MPDQLGSRRDVSPARILIVASTVLALAGPPALSRHLQDAAVLPQIPTEPEPVVLVGAGDIANCQLAGGAGAVATGRLLDSIPGTVFTVGDHAYPSGTLEEFHDCYEPGWGRHKMRTRPAPGNHDYRTADGKPYFDYFGENAGPERRGYYSYTLGSWHIV